MKLVIIDYGAGNIKSIQFAFKRLGVDAVLSSNPEEIKNAKEVLERARKKELKMNHLRQIENFKSRFVY